MKHLLAEVSLLLMKMSLDNSNGRKEPVFTQICNLDIYLDLMLEIFIYCVSYICNYLYSYMQTHILSLIKYLYLYT